MIFTNYKDMIYSVYIYIYIYILSNWKSLLQRIVYVGLHLTVCLIAHKFTSGYHIFLRTNHFLWKTRKIIIVSRSFPETYYISMAQYIRELQWPKYLLIDSVKPPKLFCDNQAALYIVTNQNFRERTEHIELDCYVR